MKKNCCALLALSLILLSACGAQPSAPSEEPVSAAPVSETPDASTSATQAQETIVLTDALDREVIVPRHPRRVAALIGSYADIWCLAGGTDTLIAAAHDTWTSFDLDLPDTVADLGAVKEPNTELLLAARPDLVLASTNTSADMELLDVLEQADINTVYFGVSTFEDYLSMLKFCTELTDCPDRYETYGTQVQEQVNEARQRVGTCGTRVLYLRASGASVKVKNSEDSVLGEMLADLGCVNIADSDTGLLEALSMESILQNDPEKIFIVVQGSDPTDAQNQLEQTVLSNPAWQQLTAVQQGQVYYMDQSLYNLKPNGRWGEAYAQLADILCGEAPQT